MRLLAEATGGGDIQLLADLIRQAPAALIVGGLLVALRKVSKERDDLFQRVLSQQEVILPLAQGLKDAVVKLGDKLTGPP